MPEFVIFARLSPDAGGTKWTGVLDSTLSIKMASGDRTNREYAPLVSDYTFQMSHQSRHQYGAAQQEGIEIGRAPTPPPRASTASPTHRRPDLLAPVAVRKQPTAASKRQKAARALTVRERLNLPPFDHNGALLEPVGIVAERESSSGPLFISPLHYLFPG